MNPVWFLRSGHAIVLGNRDGEELDASFAPSRGGARSVVGLRVVQTYFSMEQFPWSAEDLGKCFLPLTIEMLPGEGTVRLSVSHPFLGKLCHNMFTSDLCPADKWTF